jgi:hypothetical protein
MENSGMMGARVERDGEEILEVCGLMELRLDLGKTAMMVLWLRRQFHSMKLPIV